ncbi:MAG: hypothetical protein Q7S26_01670, partial [bacterium]|nr:hypothetical protein [bacterium]
MQSLGTKLIAFWDRYERSLSFGALALGFTFDLWIAKRPDSVPDNILLLSYLFIAGAIIVLVNVQKTRAQERAHPFEPLLLILILQFCFGGLAGNLLILYGKSGTVGGSALFLGLLLALLLGNEFLKSRYAQLRLTVAIYYFLLLTYCIIAVPTFLFHTIGAKVFLISGGVSLLAAGVFLFVLYSVVFRGDKSASRRRQTYEMAAVILCVLAVFNGLYFLNIIPPVPLSLKAVGVYHSITTDDKGGYTGIYEPPAWFVFWRDTAATYTIVSGQSAYCFSAVFAPGDLATSIVHRWEYFYPTTGHWITVARIGFPITGGRAEGYR